MLQLTVDAWLTSLESRHSKTIDLGLDRVRSVWDTLGRPRPAPICVVVGGTNGKGSTVAMLAAMYRNGGYRVGCYTSPHLRRYNERIRVDGDDIADAALCEAFERVERARGAVSLTYFEFGTLAAFVHLENARLDVAILEIGLGGRLDAVNLIDGDVSILTSVDLDHQDYLGDTREKIGWEKAHIFRIGRPAVIGEPSLPSSVLQVAGQIGAVVYRYGSEFTAARIDAREWQFQFSGEGPSIDCGGHDFNWTLPLPALIAPCQLRNASCAVMTTRLLADRLPVSQKHVTDGLRGVELPGRLQRLNRTTETWADVAHNPESARTLAAWLATLPPARSVAVFAALGDKDLVGIVEPLRGAFAQWITVDLRPNPRAVSPEELASRLRALSITAESAVNPEHALQSADEIAGAAGRVVVFGSFHTVAQFV